MCLTLPQLSRCPARRLCTSHCTGKPCTRAAHALSASAAAFSPISSLDACLLRSIALLEPLLTQQMREHPAWLSWVTLCALFSKVVKHSLKVTEIEDIDDLQLEHGAAFDARARVQRLEAAAAPLPLAFGGGYLAIWAAPWVLHFGVLGLRHSIR